MSTSTSSLSRRGAQPASAGRGPLLQRDYWAVLGRGQADARLVGEALANRFRDFPPPGLVRFSRRDGPWRPLCPGDEMDVAIPLVGTFGVRVTHRNEGSLTVVTLAGHPEAGRITFGAYPNRRSEVVVHIRSRARSGSRGRYWSFLAAGEPMQTLVWSDFIQRIAAALGERIRDVIHAETSNTTLREDDGPDGVERPTYRAIVQ